MLDRAWKLTENIMTQPRITRRVTTQIIRLPVAQAFSLCGVSPCEDLNPTG
jgi:hypothetical protein